MHNAKRSTSVQSGFSASMGISRDLNMRIVDILSYTSIASSTPPFSPNDSALGSAYQIILGRGTSIGVPMLTIAEDYID